MRRRDPVKRAILVACSLTAFMLLWILSTQFKVSAAHARLADSEARLKRLDEQSRLVKSNQLAIADIEGRIKALEKYSEARFFWATFLDALQRITVDKVRLVEVKAEHKYSAGDVAKLFTTNVVVPVNPPAPAWKFWAPKKQPIALATLVSNTFKNITNRPPFSTNPVPYTVKISPISTNLAEKKLTAKVEFSLVPWTREQVVVDLRGRDYGRNPGAAIDEFTKRMTSSEFFKSWLDDEEGYRFLERPPQPLPDPQDPQNPNALFVPFTIQCKLRERVLSNE